MNKFKVGDRVKVNNLAFTRGRRGKKAIIIRIEGEVVSLKFDDGYSNNYAKGWDINSCKVDLIEKKPLTVRESLMF